MPNDILWDVYAGDPAWKDVSGNRLVFCGSPKNLDVPLVVGEWQRGTHLGTTDPGIDTCGSSHVPNVRFVDTASFDGGSGQEALNDTNLIATECTLRIHIRRDPAQPVSGARLFIYDGMDTTTRAEGIKVYAAQQGVGTSAWTLINDGNAGIGGDNPGERLSLADSASATDHYYYVALSAQLQRYDTLPLFSIGFEVNHTETVAVTASADDATERLDTTVTSINDINLRLNYDALKSAHSLCGVRFLDLPIPADAVIVSAKIRLHSSAAASGTATVNIYGEQTVSPAAYAASNANISGRTKTANRLTWNIPDWLNNTWYETPDLSAIVREIIQLPGWTSGSSDMAFMLESTQATTNIRSGKAYDNANDPTPELVIQWARPRDLAERSHVQGLINFSTGDPDYEVWVLDQDQQRRFLIEEIPAGFHWEKAIQGWGSFNDLKVNVNSPAYTWLRAFERVLIRRGRHDLLAAFVEKPTSELTPDGLDAATYTCLGRSLNAILERRRCIPLAAQDYLEYTGHPDDAAKYVVRQNFCDTHAERSDDTGRAEPGFSVQPDRSECPEDPVEANRTYKYNHEQTVGEACADLAARYNLDYEVKADGEGRIDFETYYPWRGVNRAEGNPENNRQVVFTVDRENLIGVNAYKDRLKVFNVVYVLGSGQGAYRKVVICKDEASIATYGRREGVLSMGSTAATDVLTQRGQDMLAINGRPVEGVTFTFRQTEALKYGRDFDVGDYVSVYFEPFQVNLDDNWRIKRVTGTIVERAETPGETVEELEITLGKDEVDFLNENPPGGGGGSNVGPIISQEVPTTIYPDDAPGTPGQGYAGDPDDPAFNQLTSILHVHGILTDAPYDTGGRETNIEDLYAADNPGNADTQFVRRSHQHALFDTTYPEEIGALPRSRVDTDDNHAAYRSHAHDCAHYNDFGTHTHEAASAGAHTHSGNVSVDSAGAHTHSGNVSVDSAGAHTHSGSVTVDSAGAHTHSGSVTVDSAGAHTHSGNVSVGSAGAHSHLVPIAAGGAHTHATSASYISVAHCHGATIGETGGHTHTISIASWYPQLEGGAVSYAIYSLTVSSNGDHTHPMATTTDSATHTHATSGFTVDSAGAHTHTASSFTVSSGGAHTHTASGFTVNSAGAHTHTASSFTVSSGGAHTHTASGFTVNSAGDHTHATGAPA